MIKVSIKQVQNKVSELVVNGHANFAIHGEDLVCAGVSSITIGLMNALEEYKMKVTSCISEGAVKIVVDDLNDERLQLMLHVGIIQLKTMEESYSKYIRIEEEV